MTKEQGREAQGADVEKAIRAGLEDLGLNREDVDVTVLDKGSSGILGFGSRDAVVKLTLKIDPADSAESSEVTQVTDGIVEATGEESAALVPDDAGQLEIAKDEEKSEEEEVALDIVGTLLDKMQVTATCQTRWTEPDDLTGEQRLAIDVAGEDLGALIGPRGETLNSLQYLARLMTGHAIQRRPTLIMDVAGYRARREMALARLADRMADKVLKRGRAISLEPMPPNERRIIHVTLRDHKQVYTESTGDGRRRKVRIIPKD